MTRIFAILVLALATFGCALRPSRGGRVVYLDFADGSEGVIRGEEDDATRNVSSFCAEAAFARWDGIEACGDRASCMEIIRAKVERYFARFDVRFTTVRPPPGATFTTIFVAPPSAECSFGRRGVSVVDCGDANPANVGFVFDCDVDVDACAVLVAHETAHTFGLVHVGGGSDIMTLGPENPALSFESTEHPTVDDACGASSQSSERSLLDALGPRI
jgi:hypothetical protein